MIVLDTHAIIWLGENPARLSRAATQAIRNSQNASERLTASTVSLYEIAWCVLRGRIDSTLSVRELLTSIEHVFTAVPPNADIVLAAAQLPSTFPSDPFDRIIAATAMTSGAALITADERIRRSGAMRTIW
ncbi:MAG TPA: type II toxin-antitoxin system VapC family toxin [Acidobacteriaceae bacterium]|nr:type II toxin-antitoxin system VapC family toxin [Acidobacteriaceae bacterium]